MNMHEYSTTIAKRENPQITVMRAMGSTCTASRKSFFHQKYTP
jgi:hypothetical protein